MTPIKQASQITFEVLFIELPTYNFIKFTFAWLLQGFVGTPLATDYGATIKFTSYAQSKVMVKFLSEWSDFEFTKMCY